MSTFDAEPKRGPKGLRGAADATLKRRQRGTSMQWYSFGCGIGKGLATNFQSPTLVSQSFHTLCTILLYIVGGYAYDQ